MSWVGELGGIFKRVISTKKTGNTKLAEQLLEQAIKLDEQGEAELAIADYQKVIKAARDWATPYYNLGLLYKYRGDWRMSFANNKKALELRPDNEAARWNLGIAATVLFDWKTARECWNYFGLGLEVTDEEPDLELGRTPVRLNPDDDGEVVWCKRIDPARAIIKSIPLASSGHRYGDMVLNDGAPVGSRISDGVGYSVFNELQLLSKSKFSTYSITAYTNEQWHIDKLIDLCKAADVEVEDWSTIQLLCKQCSEGVVHDHHDDELKHRNNDDRHIGFAAENQEAILGLLADWRTISLCEHSELILELE